MSSDSGLEAEMVSLEAANTAVRLNPELLPPIGSMVLAEVLVSPLRSTVRSGWVVDHRVRRRINRNTWSWVSSVELVATVYKIAYHGDSHKFSFWPEQLSEIISLPEDCPPISAWKRIRDLLGTSDRETSAGLV